MSLIILKLAVPLMALVLGFAFVAPMGVEMEMPMEVQPLPVEEAVGEEAAEEAAPDEDPLGEPE